MIRVLVVSPSARTRRALEQLLARDEGLALVGTRDGVESLGLAIGASRPDVVVLDGGPESRLPGTLLLEQGPGVDPPPPRRGPARDGVFSGTQGSGAPA